MKRIFLFLATNLAIMLVLGLVVSITGANTYLSANGLDLGTLLLWSGIMGFGGSFMSLLMSKTIAKWSTGAKNIEQPATENDRWLLETVSKIAQKANIAMPEVAVYDGTPNAFATGASANSALVAVSTGLMQAMSRDEIEAVLAHEVAHIKNGDMVTLTLIQGVVNTFVFFLARVVGYVVEHASRRNDSESEQTHGGGFGYMVTVFICELVFGLLASLVVMFFSRQREFRADAGAASLLGSPKPMIAALKKLQSQNTGDLPQNMAAFGIAGTPNKLLALFSSHPPIEQRIKSLNEKTEQPFTR